MREFCYLCFHAKRVCYCADIKPITPRTQFVILRHTRERRRTIGTAQITHRFLANSIIRNGAEFESDAVVNQLLEDQSRNCFVLYPGESSIHIDQAPLSHTKPVVIFVIDGTWLDAKQILRQSPKIAALPRISFSAGALSEYKFRKQPADFCLSTIESIQRILSILEPELKSDQMLDVFRKMVQTQINFERIEKLQGNQKNTSPLPPPPLVSAIDP